MEDEKATLEGSNRNEYVTIIELTDDKGTKNIVNLFASTPEGAFANMLQVEQLYKKDTVSNVNILGTYGRTSFAVIDRNRIEEM